MNYNKVILGGNLTRDPEIKFLASGSAVCAFGLAVNRTWKTETGEKKEEVTFVDVTAFGKTAETISQYCKKGSNLFVEGRLRLEQWNDKTTGQKRTKMSVVVENFQFVGGKREESAARQPAAQAPPTPTAAATGAPPPEDDVPF